MILFVFSHLKILHLMPLQLSWSPRLGSGGFILFMDIFMKGKFLPDRLNYVSCSGSVEPKSYIRHRWIYFIHGYLYERQISLIDWTMSAVQDLLSPSPILGTGRFTLFMDIFMKGKFLPDRLNYVSCSGSVEPKSYIRHRWIYFIHGYLYERQISPW